jgi:ligand-binding sensor domain-containing protein/signal transduction histidine kinase
MFFRTILVATLLLLTRVVVLGQYNFFHLSTENGLYSSNIRCIVQDYQDFVWIGTEDGLHRYDGNTLLVYKNNPEDSTSLSSNYILSLFQDSKKNLWIGTLDGGLLLYDRDKDCFRRFGKSADKTRVLAGNSVTSIFEDTNQFLLVSTEAGFVNYFKIPEHKFARPEVKRMLVPDKSKDKKWNNDLSPITIDNRGTLWISFNGNGIYKVEIDKNAAYAYLPGKITSRIITMKIDSQRRLWIGTWDDGLYVVDILSNNMAHFLANGSPNSILNNSVTQVEEDKEGNVWVGTDDGVNIFESSGSPFHNPTIVSLRADEEDNRSLLSNPVKSIAIDRDGRVWIGTYYGGVNIYDKNAPDFITVKKKNRPGSLSHNNVSAILIDNRKRVWVGTDGGGLNFARNTDDLFAGKLSKVSLKNEISNFEEKKVKCIAADSSGNIWVGSWGGGLYKINGETLKPTRLTKGSSKFSLPSNEIVALLSDNEERLWGGTFGAGLFSIDLLTEEVERYPLLQRDGTSNFYDNITCLYLDKEQRLWVAREGGGISYRNPETGKFVGIDHPLLPKTLTILTIFQDPTGIFWLGSNSNGLIRYDAGKNIAERLDERNGIANSVVHAIELGNDRKLWMSTNSGISSLDPEKRTFENFSGKQGLQDNQFNTNSSFRSKKGLLFFGGIGGMNAFNAHEIKPYSPVSKLAFTGFWVDNAPYTVQNGNLPRNIILVDSIELNHTQNNISIEFAAVDHNFAADRKYAFLLEDLNEEWQYINREHKATFTNLAPGHYRLHIKSSDNEGRWTEAERDLHIYIRPAWWQTWIFRISMAVLAAAAAYFSIRWRISFLQAQKRTLEELVSLRTTELKQKNDELAVMVKEITKQNSELNSQRKEIAAMNQAMQAQNNELMAQNDQISQQREELEVAQEKLKFTNDKLEKLVDQRTKKLKTTIRQLDKTVFELDRFVYSASHDLSAPLKSILGLIRLAKMENDISRLHEYHHYIEESIHKLELVIKSLIDYSRNTHTDLDYKEARPHGLADEIIRDLMYLPEALDVHFNNHLSADLLITTDPSRLKLVLQNVISNAIKYSDPDKEEKLVSIHGDIQDDVLKIRVKDNGIGISSESLPKIFSMYYRATEKSKGSGLGLFIVRETIHKLNGTISVQSEAGKGSTFIIQLPLTIKEPGRVYSEKES